MLKSRPSHAALATFACFVWLSACAALPAADPPTAAARLWKDVPGQAEVLSATFLGGKGHDWLVGGGFQPDGTIVLVGNVAGPVLGMALPEKVIGTDLPAPPEAKRVPVMDRGTQKTDKEGKPMWEKPSWRHDGVTGFVVHCSGDLKRVLAVHRLPWTSGAITAAAIGKDGAIYIAGRATDKIAALGGNVQGLPVAESTRKDGRCQQTFVARLTPGADRAVWVLHVKGYSDAPQLTLTADNQLRFGSQELFVLDLSGKLLRTIHVPGGVRNLASVSADYRQIVTGGEHHWKTGREPWRCPTLNVHNPDGSLKYQLYDWGGPYVGLDNCRQVSDTAVRWVTHDRDGNILIYAWSDGGNSVATTQPGDVRTGVGMRGLGLTSAGAGVLSCAYLIRIEPKNYHVTGYTMWLAFSQVNKPNSVWIDTLKAADDGSFCFGGRSAWGLSQTRNKLLDCEPTGDYVAILNHEMNGVRFCSFVPNSAVAEVTDGSAKGSTAWGVVAGTVGGKQRVLFVGSAAERESGDKPATPTKNAMQAKLAGGWCDGYVVMLEWPTATGESAVAEGGYKPEPGPTSASFERGARPRGGKKGGGAPPEPAEGAVFNFQPSYPGWVTVDAEFRDRQAKLWPNFFYGKPFEGKLKYTEGLLQGKLTVACTSACQPRGDQSRKVLGELFKGDEVPKLSFTLESLGPPKTVEQKAIDKGKEVTRTIEYREATGVLEVGEKKLKVQPRMTVSYGGPKEGGIDNIRLNAFLTLKASELGLKMPTGEIDLRLGFSGTTLEKAPPKVKKK